MRESVKVEVLTNDPCARDILIEILETRRCHFRIGDQFKYPRGYLSDFYFATWKVAIDVVKIFIKSCKGQNIQLESVLCNSTRTDDGIEMLSVVEEELSHVNHI